MAMNLMEHANHAMSVAGNLWESAASWPLSWYTKIPVMLIAAALGAALLVTVAKALMYATVEGVQRAKEWTHNASVALARVIVESGAGFLEGIGNLAVLVLRVLWMPARMALDEMLGVMGRVQKRIELEMEMRKIWRDQYRERFTTFREFRAAFENGMNDDAAHDDNRREEPKFDEEEDRIDSFAAACSILKLPEDGSFTKAQLEASFRKLMMQAHPDRGGSAQAAAALNRARDIVCQEKGWKS